MATASCFAVMPQVASNASTHAGGKAARGHDHTTPHRDHNGREGGDRERGHANLVVDTRGPRGAIVPGRTYKWPFEVTNRGSVPARDVALTATPDKSLKVLAAPPKCRWHKTGPLVCKIGLLPQGKTRRGIITATVVPRTRGGRPLSNPVQVSWRNAPRPERRTGAFPPVVVSPGTGAPAAREAKVPYPVMVTEHAPGTAESVVVRSPIGLPAPNGPCAVGVAPSTIAGKSMPIKPALGSCGAEPDDLAACACGVPHGRPVADVPAGYAVPDGPVLAPCGAVAARPVATPPCVHGGGAVDVPDRPVLAPCGAVADRPVVTPPCVHDGGAAGVPVARPCDADEGRPVILPAPVPPVAVPDTPCAAAAKEAAEKAAAAKEAAEQAAAEQAAKEKAAEEKARADKVAAEQAAAEQAAADKAEANHAGVPIAAPCGAAATSPVVVPGRPVIVPEAPAIPPCAQGRPAACGCLSGANASLAPVTAPVGPSGSIIPGFPGLPVTPGAGEAAPCTAAADKPMAVDGSAAEAPPAGPSCGAAADAAAAPAAVHEDLAAAPDSIAPTSPLTGPGKASLDPLGGTGDHAGLPRGRGHAHRDCVRQGSGFVCPLGSAPRHRPHVVNLARPSHPHGLHCGPGAAACHTRTAHPIAARPMPVRRELPVTGGSSALLALSGLGLAGAGVVLYRLSRTRRGGEG
ncbi:hypothetical protein [Actinomadura sp. DC4]|uniref:hypothetical protein n=1 Tax=Actinomadura sp. DC4 TaxID=3055069 RepID=UPI0025B03DCC|nr:hypothetical protein [Actinomadura sp. DC4]MDN3355064.1 hypothetical protein [Actinomadura sp. DC4]